MGMFHLDKQNAEELLEIYKGVVPEYHGYVEELACGQCIALEVSKEHDCVEVSFNYKFYIL